MSYENYWDPVQIESVYLPEVKNALKECLAARHVHVLDYVVRKNHSGRCAALRHFDSKQARKPHESFPFSTGKNYKYDQPMAMCHIGIFLEAPSSGDKLIYERLYRARGRAHNTIVLRGQQIRCYEAIGRL